MCVCVCVLMYVCVCRSLCVCVSICVIDILLLYFKDLFLRTLNQVEPADPFGPHGADLSYVRVCVRVYVGVCVLTSHNTLRHEDF